LKVTIIHKEGGFYGQIFQPTVLTEFGIDGFKKLCYTSLC